MNRDEFLQMMISHLEEMNEEDNLNTDNSQNSPNIISNILKKLSYDYPLLDDQQIRIFSEFLLLFGTPNYEDGENFKLTPLFLENMKYIRTAPSYSQHQNTSHLFEGVFLFLPLALMKYNKARLIEIFDRVDSDEVTWNILFHQVFSLIDVTVPSIIAGNRAIPLSEATLGMLLNKLSHIVHILTPSNTSLSEISSIDDYYSMKLQYVVSQASLEVEPDTLRVVNKTINLFSGLLFFVRDLCTLKDDFSIRVIPLLFDQVLIPLLQIPSRQLQSFGYVVGAGIIFQLQLSCIFLLSDICSSYLLMKPNELYQGSFLGFDIILSLVGVRMKLLHTLNVNMSIIVSCTEMILNSITSDQSMNDNKVVLQLLESLSTLPAATCIALNSSENYDLSQMLLSSRLFPVLSSLLVKPIDEVPVRNFYMNLNVSVKLRLLCTLATITNLADPSLSIYIHKIFLPIILRCETNQPLSMLGTSRTNIPALLSAPIIAILMGSIKSNQNQTAIKCFEKSLIAYMKSRGDTTEMMSSTVPMTDIIEKLLSEIVTEVIEKYEFVISHPLQSYNENSESIEDDNQRHIQRCQQDLRSTLLQVTELIELLLVVRKKFISLPMEYTRMTETINVAFNELTRRLNSLPSIPEISEIKKHIYQIVKLVKSYNNFITSNNSKTD